MNKNLVDTVLKAVALAMGVVVVVLNILGMLEVNTAMTFLGFGLSALALSALQNS